MLLITRNFSLTVVILCTLYLNLFSYGQNSSPNANTQPIASPTISATPTQTPAPSPSPSPSPSSALISPEMVTAIGSLWPLAVLAILGILIIVLRKPLRTLLENIVEKSGKADKLELKAGGLGVSLTQAAVIAEEKAQEKAAERAEEETVPAKQDAAQVDKDATQVDEATKIEPKTSGELTVALFDALHEQNSEKVEELYKKLQDSESDAVQKLKNEALYLYIRFQLADPSAIDKLQELTKREEVAAKAYGWLGYAYESANELDKAADAFHRAAQVEATEESQVSLIVRAAKCYAQIGKEEQAHLLIRNRISVTTDNASLSELYKGLASIYALLDETELRALALEKAVENAPNNTSLLFDVAYAFGEIEKRAMSILHYRAILKFNPKSYGAMNNLGVAYEKLNMSILSVRAYKGASELNHTLASANLAYRYMYAGFADEALEILDKAQQQEDVHPNVSSAVSALSEKEEAETKRRDKITADALQQQQYLRSYANEYFISKSPANSFDGVWQFSDNVEVTIIRIDNRIEANWLRNNKKFQFTGEVSNQAAKIIMYKMNYSYLDPKVETSFEKEAEGYAYLSEDGQKLELMKLKDNEHSFITLMRKSDEPSTDEE